MRGPITFTANIFQPNCAAKSLFKSQGYSYLLGIKTCARGVRKEAKLSDELWIDRLRDEDLPEAADLQCWGAGVERAPVFRPEMNRTTPYAMNLNIL
ncbi:hypothetical protein ASZ90_013632 [hydrocarbon metagenome]|uniref:Uncharacterized protein n=1 Tax=hydrocarbon metagenome TaxID=938273 RepID=A0A0W8F813_9ZZZZ